MTAATITMLTTSTATTASTSMMMSVTSTEIGLSDESLGFSIMASTGPRSIEHFGDVVTHHLPGKMSRTTQHQIIEFHTETVSPNSSPKVSPDGQ